MKWINYHHLIYFREILLRGGVSKASKALRVSQPSLTQQLKCLEETLGVELFERKKNRLYPTPVAESILPKVNQISELGQEILATVSRASGHDLPALCIGALDNVPKSLISHMCLRIKEKKDHRLTILEGAPEHLYRLLSGGLSQILILDDPAVSRSLNEAQVVPFFHAPINAYASPEYIERFGEFGDNEVQAIMPTHHSLLRSDLEHFFNIHQIPFRCIAETQDTMVQKLLALQGQGICFMPEFAMTDYCQQNRLVKLASIHQVSVKYHLVYHPKRLAPELAELFKDLYVTDLCLSRPSLYASENAEKESIL